MERCGCGSVGREDGYAGAVGAWRTGTVGVGLPVRDRAVARRTRASMEAISRGADGCDVVIVKRGT